MCVCNFVHLLESIEPGLGLEIFEGNFPCPEHFDEELAVTYCTILHPNVDL